MRSPILVALLASALAGCGPSLAVTAVEPSRLEAGRAATLTVEGAGFEAGLTLSLVAPGLDVTLGAVEVLSTSRATGRVPASIPAGRYALVAAQGGASARVEAAVEAVSGILRVVFLDVGQGDATLIVAPSGEVALFDAGPRSAGPALREALQRYVDGRIDVVALSHVDADHLGGLVTILAGADGRPGTSDDVVPPVRLAPTDDGSCATDLCRDMRLLAAHPFEAPEVGRVVALGDVEIEVVAADGRIGGEVVAGADEENERSLVLLIRWAGRTVLVTGDLTGGGLGTASLEGPLSSSTGPVDVLRASHHGSATSSDPIALQRWQPRAVVASLGTDNAYCHPAPEVVARWEATGARLWSTGAGIVEDGARCDGPTAWPSHARVGEGDVVLEITAGGDMTIGGEAL